jgi:broad specificity phosphatase PhoE
MILLRHGQSEFNVAFTATRRDPGIKDPKLTPLGHQQAAAAAQALKSERISRIIVSPYTRALQTAAVVADALDVPVTVNPTVRERFAFVCDIGTPCTELARAWPQHDFSTIEEVWWPPEEEPADSIIDRAALFRHALGLHPGDDRHSHRQRRVAALRSDGSSAARAGLAPLTEPVLTAPQL